MNTVDFRNILNCKSVTLVDKKRESFIEENWAGECTRIENKKDEKGENLFYFDQSSTDDDRNRDFPHDNHPMTSCLGFYKIAKHPRSLIANWIAINNNCQISNTRLFFEKHNFFKTFFLKWISIWFIEKRFLRKWIFSESGLIS